MVTTTVTKYGAGVGETLGDVVGDELGGPGQIRLGGSSAISHSRVEMKSPLALVLEPTPGNPPRPQSIPL